MTSFFESEARNRSLIWHPLFYLKKVVKTPTLTYVEKINLVVATFMSTKCKVTTKTSIQYVILPFIY